MMYWERWYWCSGCGRWHDYTKHQNTHTLMICDYEEPSAKNFDGTLDELRRFKIAQRLRFQDVLDFEKRIEEEIELATDLPDHDAPHVVG